MPRTPDRFPGASDEEAVQLETTVLSTIQGEMRYDGSRFTFFDSVGEYDPRAGGGISAAQHEALDTLVHNLAESFHLDITRDSQGRVATVTAWTDATKTTKVRDVVATLVRDSQGRVSTFDQQQYDGSGVAIVGQKLSWTINRDSQGRVDDIDLVES